MPKRCLSGQHARYALSPYGLSMEQIGSGTRRFFTHEWKKRHGILLNTLALILGDLAGSPSLISG